MKYKDFLQEEHATILNEEGMYPDYETWLSQLDIDEWIAYGEIYALRAKMEIMK